MESQVLTQNNIIQGDSLQKVINRACKKIAPLWSLENFVAVNPYLGLTDHKFESAAQTLAIAGGIQSTLPISFYIGKFKEGIITRQDLERALLAEETADCDVDHFIDSLGETENDSETIATVMEVASRVTGTNWSRFVTASVSTWAASYFDVGQAAWKVADTNKNIFSGWKAEAEVDRTPEIIGLPGFRKVVKALPENPMDAIQAALASLEIAEQDLPIYLHGLLLRVGGWSAYVARLDWDRQLNGQNQGALLEFLAVLISWEASLLQCLESPTFLVAWLEAKRKFAELGKQKRRPATLSKRLILQSAFDVATQRAMIDKFNNRVANSTEQKKAVKAQAVFCIDVRSEVYRRNLESVDDGVETIGFAGFFGFPINYIPIAYDQGRSQCPALITTGATILEEIPDAKAHQRAYRSRILNNQVSKLWKTFRSGAVTCFSFVSPLGLSYLPKLFTDTFGLTRPVPDPDRKGLSKKFVKTRGVRIAEGSHQHQAVGLPLDQRLGMAKNALNAMSLTQDFANFVLIVGHGSTSVNNPHATGLDCGACGGHSGEANAQVAAAILNDPEVRFHLQKEHIHIPESTVFLACKHDTTTDEVTIFNEQVVAEKMQSELQGLKKSLEKAGRATRSERALRLSVEGNIDLAVKARSKDWSQVRPEWGLAGCSSFIVAPRKRTAHLDLGGRSFLHSYDWDKDENFSVLELIMTAPMVVTSWINLQYYASTVDNQKLGAGNKTLHNVTAGIGVLEGFSGDLRVGLPMQSIHDGENYQHEPVRLSVVIEAPIEAMNTIIEKQEAVRNLCDNEWIYLYQMDDQGQIAYRYTGDLNWERV